MMKPVNWNSLAFYEKIAYYGQNLTEIHAQYVDKLNVKSILCEKYIPVFPELRDLHVARVVRVLSDKTDLKEADISSHHIIKGAHGCKFNINMLNTSTFANVKNKLMSFPLSYETKREQQYKFIKPQFFIEEKVNDFHTGLSGQATVYMVRCIRGVPVSIGIILGGRMNNYYIDWRVIQEEISAQVLRLNEIRNDITRMIEMSRSLSQSFEFVRVDFYLDSSHSIFFSEFTFTPSCGNMVYPTRAIEYELGKTW